MHKKGLFYFLEKPFFMVYP